ncbi:MAG: SBBP repeat-containing protein, partial [Candidatus Hodarchaeota archaeon]
RAAEWGQGIALDSQDNVLVTGYTGSSDFPVRNAYNGTGLGEIDAFLSKFTVNGVLQWSTYVGTIDADYGTDVAIDSQDNIFLVGYRRHLIVWLNSYDTIFLHKFNTAGAWMWGTEIGGSNNDQGHSIALDSHDNIFIAGITNSNNFPTLNASYSRLNAGSGGVNFDAFVLGLNSSGNLIWSTYLGGGNDETVAKVQTDSQGNIIAAGATSSSNFPLLDAVNPNLRGTKDGFVSKFSGTTYGLIWSTFLGGSAEDEIFGVAVDWQDNIVVSGLTRSEDFLLVNPYDDQHYGTDEDAFISKFNSNGAIEVSTYFGMSLEDLITTSTTTQIQDPLIKLITDLFESGFMVQAIIIMGLVCVALFGFSVLIRRRRRREKKPYQDNQSMIKVMLFSVPYGFRVLLKNKRKYLSLITSFTLVVAFIMAMFLWVELSPDVAIRQAMNQTSYHLTVRTTSNSIEHISVVNQWLLNQPWVETTGRIRPNIALLGTDDKFANYTWSPIDPNNPIYITSKPEVNVLTNDFLEMVAYHFTWDGNFQVNQTHCLVSKQFLDVLSDTFNWTLGVGDSFNISLASNIPETHQRKLSAWDLHNLSLTIGGIYERVPQASLTGLSFVKETLSDGIFLANESLPVTYFNALRIKETFTETVFVRLNTAEILKGGVLQLHQQIESIKDRINTRYYGFDIQEQTHAAYEEIEKYQNTRILILIIFAPVILCSAYLVFFWTNFHNKTRREELRILRSRGGNLKQVFGLIGAETIGISLLGGIPGVLLGGLFTYFLMNEGQLIFELDSFWAFSIKLLDFATTWMIGVGACIGLLLFASLWRVFKFVQVEMELKRETESSLQVFVANHAVDIGLLTVGMFTLMLIIDVDSIALILRSQYYGLFLFCMLGTWFGIGQLLARSVSRLASFLTRHLSGRLGPQAILIGKNFERQRENTFVVAMLFIITFSISVFVVIFLSSAGTNAILISDFETGSDFKIYTSYQDLSFTQILESDPGIEQCMAIQKSHAWLGPTSKVQIYGVNASEYPQIGDWDPTSMLSGTPEENFQRLNATTNGIIINDLLARRFEKEVGDRIVLKVWTYGGHTELQFKIVGIAYAVPGLGVLKGLGNLESILEDYGGVLVNGREMLGEEYDYINTADLFLARAPASHNSTNHFETQNRLIQYSQVRHIELSEALPDVNLLSLVGMNGILWLNLIGALIILLVLIIFFFGTIVYERKTEFAIMRACGASVQAVKRLVFWEELLLLAVTLAEGYGLGVLFAWIFTSIAFPAIYYPTPLPYVLDIPPLFVLGLLVTSFLLLIIGSSISSRQITGQKIALILKNL